MEGMLAWLGPATCHKKPARSCYSRGVVFLQSWIARVAIGGAVGLAVGLAVVSASGCKSSGSAQGPTDASAADNRRADERLQGHWRIQDFRPETPLDPTMATMLGFYQPTLILEVQQGRIRALTSANDVHFDRRYEV